VALREMLGLGIGEIQRFARSRAYIPAISVSRAGARTVSLKTR
jgi:hypothetical protein